MKSEVPFQSGMAYVSLCVPKFHRAIATLAGNPLTIGTKAHGPDLAVMSVQCMSAIPRVCIPKLESAIAAIVPPSGLIDPITGETLSTVDKVLTDDSTDRLIGGDGNDTFVFNTLLTGLDIIEDFTVRVDKIRINAAELGATSNDLFSFDNTNGALSFNSQQFATLETENPGANLDGFNVNN